MPKNHWSDLLQHYSADDALPVRTAGPWTADKLFFWNRYIEITTNAMVGHPKWRGAGLAYVDLFAGPGICVLDGSGQRIPGSTLIAAHAPKPFSVILAAELDASLALALEARLQKTPAAGNAKVFQGNCNVCIQQIVASIPPRALTLAFVDPENLNVDFHTIERLAACGQVDLLILFADRMDLVRNVDLYERRAVSVLDRMMGPGSRWRERWPVLHNRNAVNICRFFADEFERQLKERLGYIYFGEKVMRSRQGPLYTLIFASKNPKGGEFWQKVTKKDRGGQLDMF